MRLKEVVLETVLGWSVFENVGTVENINATAKHACSRFGHAGDIVNLGWVGPFFLQLILVPLGSMVIQATELSRLEMEMVRHLEVKLVRDVELMLARAIELMLARAIELMLARPIMLILAHRIELKLVCHLEQELGREADVKRDWLEALWERILREEMGT